MDELLDVTKDSPILKRSLWTKPEDPKYAELEEQVTIIKVGCGLISRSYIQIGFALKEIRDRKLFKAASDGYNTFEDIETFAFKVFGFSRTTTYNLLGVVSEFCDSTKKELKEWYTGYSYSKLVEMLPLPYMQYKIIDSTATVSEIRELKKIWDKYGFDGNQTWKEALRKGRERMAEEANAERTAKAQQKTAGLLSLLNASPETGETVVAEVVESKEPEKIKRLNFKNDEEIKLFLKQENLEKLPLIANISQLNLKFHRYDFANGDSLIVKISHSYDYKKTYCCYCNLQLLTQQKRKYDDCCLTYEYVFEYLKAHKDEL